MTRELPHNQEAEIAVIASIIINSDNLYKLVGHLEVNDFYFENTRQIYKACLTLLSDGSAIDLLTVTNQLDRTNTLKKAGGRTGIIQITQASVIVANLERYADMVKDCSIRRQLIHSQTENESDIYNTELQIKDVLTTTQSRVFRIGLVGNEDNSIESSIQSLEVVQERYAEKYKQGFKYLGISTGISRIDEATEGFQSSHLWAVGAWSSTGKTMFALNLLIGSLESGVACSMISLEMSRVDLVARMIGIKCGISATEVKRGIISKETMDAISNAKSWLRSLNLSIYTNHFDIESIKMLIRKDVYTRKSKIIMIDYVQLIQSSNGAREYDLMTKVAVDLQALARELGITIFMVSQISNESEKGSGAGAGLKGTGAFEAAADIVIKLKRNKGEEEVDAPWVPVDIIISKNRHGFSGTIKGHGLELKSGRYVIDPSLTPGHYLPKK